MARGRRAVLLLLALALGGSLLALVASRWVGGARQVRDAGTIVEPVPPDERRDALDRAERSTREGRDAARREMGSIPPAR